MEPDLPEPRRPAFNPEERQRRTRGVFLIFLYVLCVYSLVHKVAIPVVLKFTLLSSTPYAHIDAAALLPVLVLYFFRKGNLGWIGSLLAGASIAYGGAESYLILKGQYPGWLGVSRFLSSVPLSIWCIAVLTGGMVKPVVWSAWSGAMVILLAARFPLLSSRPPSLVRASVAVTVPSASNEGMECRPLVLQVRPTPLPLLTALDIGNCGFTPKLASLAPETLRVTNSLGDPVNLHLVISKGDGPLRAGGNWMVPSKETLVLRLPKLSDGEVGMWYSDTHPQLGIAGGFSAGLEGNVELTRQPLKIKRVQ